VIYVPKLKKNFVLVSILDDMGFFVMFKKGKVLISSYGSSLDTTMSIGVREDNLYKLLGKIARGSKGILYLVHSYVNGSMSMEEGSEGRIEFRDFQCMESTFRWGGGVSLFYFYQKIEQASKEVSTLHGANE
jgi:hypothetical protein